MHHTLRLSPYPEWSFITAQLSNKILARLKEHRFAGSKWSFTCLSSLQCSFSASRCRTMDPLALRRSWRKSQALYLDKVAIIYVLHHTKAGRDSFMNLQRLCGRKPDKIWRRFEPQRSWRRQKLMAFVVIIFQWAAQCLSSEGCKLVPSNSDAPSLFNRNKLWQSCQINFQYS